MHRRSMKTLRWFLDVRTTHHEGRWIAFGHLGPDNPIGHGATPRAALADWNFKMRKQIRRKHGYFLHSAPRKARRLYQGKFD